MTAEIAIMNKEAVALATDSAATMSDNKIFASANKLFALSKYQPVGIMVYGSAVFMDVPWETIIKIYRARLGKTKLATLGEHAQHFIDFLGNPAGNGLFPASVQDAYMRDSIFGYFRFIRDVITKRVHSRLDEKGEIDDEEILEIVSATIEEHYKKWQEAGRRSPVVSDVDFKKLKATCGNIVAKATGEVFERLPLSKEHLDKLRDIAGNLFIKFPEDVEIKRTSGVVVAGFGETDIFPSLESFIVEGMATDKLKYIGHISRKIDFGMVASIIPFAQREMVATFMEGVDPAYGGYEQLILSQTLEKYAGAVVDSLKMYSDEEKGRLKGKLKEVNGDILEYHRKTLEVHRKERYINPVTNVVSVLPKDELAAMAESLVNLTSFKRRVTMESETVGGPIDVAVISKGDGFIWIKRKHYFKAELNPQFLGNYYAEV